MSTPPQYETLCAEVLGPLLALHAALLQDVRAFGRELEKRMPRRELSAAEVAYWLAAEDGYALEHFDDPEDL